MSRRAFTLIEAVLCVMVLAIAVPPTLDLIMSAAADRADAVNTTRAATLASLVLESVIADTASTDAALGFDALANSSAYLDTPTTGLRARLAAMTTPYEAIGMSYDLDISSPVDAANITNADASLNLFRIVTVRVTYPSASGDPIEMPVATMVGDLP